jgi:hypothetical protein
MDKLARIAGGVSLIAAPLTLVASELLYVSGPDDPGRGLATIAAHESSWLTANLLGLLAAALFIPAVMTLAWLPGAGRGCRWAVVGAVLGAVGIVGYAAHTGTFIVIGQMARQATGQTGEQVPMADLLDALDGNAAFGVVIGLFLIGLYLGLVLLMVGAWRARRVPLWSMVCVIAAVVLASVPIVDGTEYVAETLVIVGLGVAGVEVLRGSARPVHEAETGAPLPSGATPLGSSTS